MPDEKDAAELADQREAEADKLEERSKQLAEDVEDTRQDWHQKRSDPGVPGAPPHEDEFSDDDDESAAGGADSAEEDSGGEDSDHEDDETT